MALFVGLFLSTFACFVAFLIGCAWMHGRARAAGYEQGMADMYATKKLAYQHWREALCRTATVAGVDEAEGRHAASRAALESPTDVFNVIMRREFIEDGAE